MKRKSLRKRRHQGIRKRISGTSDIPRLNVFRSNKHIYAQVIDDEKHETLVSSCSLGLSVKEQQKTGKVVARLVGERLGKELKKEKLLKIVFDRGGYRYHGRVKALAEAVRKAGIVF